MMTNNYETRVVRSTDLGRMSNLDCGDDRASTALSANTGLTMSTDDCSRQIIHKLHLYAAKTEFGQ